MALVDFMDESSEMFEEAMKTARDFDSKKYGEAKSRSRDNIKTIERDDRKIMSRTPEENLKDWNRRDEIEKRHRGKSPEDYMRASDAEARHNRRHANEGAIELF